MRTLVLAGILVLAAYAPAGAQEGGEKSSSVVPKKGDSITVKGCLRGGALDATVVTGAERSDNQLTGPLRFRFNGDKSVLKSLKTEHDGRIVEVRGILKSDWPSDPQARQVGRVRIAIGAPTPSPNSPEASARRPQPALDVASFSGHGTSCGR
jgi:hypothetical protein